MLLFPRELVAGPVAPGSWRSSGWGEVFRSEPGPSTTALLPLYPGCQSGAQIGAQMRTTFLGNFKILKKFMCFEDKDLAFVPLQELRKLAPKRAPLLLRVEGTFMTSQQLIALIACLAACAYFAGLLLGAGFAADQSSRAAGLTHAPFLGRVCAAGFSLFDGVGRLQQMEPSQHPAGPGNEFPGTSLRLQRDLFGTPFGPLFGCQNAKNQAKRPFLDKLRFIGSLLLSKWCSRGESMGSGRGFLRPNGRVPRACAFVPGGGLVGRLLTPV